MARPITSNFWTLLVFSSPLFGLLLPSRDLFARKRTLCSTSTQEDTPVLCLHLHNYPPYFLPLFSFTLILLIYYPLLGCHQAMSGVSNDVVVNTPFFPNRSGRHTRAHFPREKDEGKGDKNGGGGSCPKCLLPPFSLYMARGKTTGVKKWSASTNQEVRC